MFHLAYFLLTDVYPSVRYYAWGGCNVFSQATSYLQIDLRLATTLEVVKVVTSGVVSLQRNQ